MTLTVSKLYWNGPQADNYYRIMSDWIRWMFHTIHRLSERIGLNGNTYDLDSGVPTSIQRWDDDDDDDDNNNNNNSNNNNSEFEKPLPSVLQSNSGMCLRWCVDNSLARPGRKQATAT